LQALELNDVKKMIVQYPKAFDKKDKEAPVKKAAVTKVGEKK
jgi:hypothetical protein